VGELEVSTRRPGRVKGALGARSSVEDDGEDADDGNERRKFPMTIELHEREDSFARVAVVYHGKDAEPKITVEVEDKSSGRSFTYVPRLGSDGAETMDVFNHPFAYAPRDWQAQPALAA
jgi:hypothetical protein